MTPERIRAMVADMAFVEGVNSPPDEYERRLAVCAGCPALVAGTQCGYSSYYVAFRARVLSAGCPFPGGDRWRDC